MIAILVLGLSLPAAASQVVTMTAKEIDEPREETIDPAFITTDGGFGYTAVPRMGRLGDSETGNESDCTLLEDGKPLGPARALHANIRTEGRGAYSHWTAGALYFSASDNSNPAVNGRTYTLVSRVRGVRHRAVVSVARPSASYEIEVPGRIALTRRMILRNLDSRAAVMPLLRVRGQPDLTSTEGMLKSILKPEMTPEQKSIAVWKFLVDWRYHYFPAQGDDEIHDPVKFISVYGYGFCDDSAQNFAALCEGAGMKARVWGLNGHVVAESFFDDGWHMFDPDHEVYYRASDRHILSVEELAKDPSAITATPNDPVGGISTVIATLYTTTADNGVWRRSSVTPAFRLDPVLRPGDEVVFDLGPAKLVHAVHSRNEAPPPKAANGTLKRRVEIPAGKTELLIPVRWPYVLLGGELAFAPAGEVHLSTDGSTWTRIATKAEAGGFSANVTPWFVAQDAAHYGFTLRVRGAVKEATLNVLFQFAPRALPQVHPGKTTFEITLAPVAGEFPSDWKGVEVTHEIDRPFEAGSK